MNETTRDGKTLKTLDAGDPRRMSDGRNAWRKMSPSQRRDFRAWQDAEKLPEAKAKRGSK